MIGHTISHYKILEKLGEGGMGVVYMAEDTKLERKVALKFLPTQYTSDLEIVERFQREAKAAAALNHPNIITVYEVGEHEGQTFIAMEYVKGESLRDRMKQELSPNESIELISQVCDGLSKAHKADIVHRDIKPENIMIDEDGRVRILDFGLAKLKNVSKLTQTATTLGTLNYISPEQLQGLEVDARSDIWSVGVVLYEMITGQLPFRAEYEAAISYSILNEEPEPLAHYKTGVSEGLQRIIDKALDKDLQTRYQNSADLLTDLKREKKNSSGFVKPILTDNKRVWKKTKLMFACFTLLAAIIAVVSLYYVFLTPAQKELPSWLQQNAPLSRITSESGVERGRISPDGNYVAYQSQSGIKLRILKTGEIRNIFDFEGGDNLQLSWSSDGTQLAIAKFDDDWVSSTLLICSFLGNITYRSRSPGTVYYPTWSPNGTQLAYFSLDGDDVDLVTVNLDGSNERKFPMELISHPTWSPDSRKIAFIERITQGRSAAGTGLTGSIRLLDVETDALSDTLNLNGVLAYAGAWWLGGLAWSPDGRYLVYVGLVDNNRELFALPVNPKAHSVSGPPIQITHLRGNGQPFWPTFTRDGKQLSFGIDEENEDIYLIPIDIQSATVSGKSTAVATDRRYDGDPYLMPDGKGVVFVSKRDGQSDLYSFRFESNETKRLTYSETIEELPQYSPDGSIISFLAENAVWGIPVSGGPAKKLASGLVPLSYAWFSDGQSLFVTIADSSAPELCNLVQIDLSTESQSVISKNFKLNKWAVDISLSPDGRQLAVRGVAISADSIDYERIGVLDFETGEMNDLLTQAIIVPRGRISWTVDGQHILYDRYDSEGKFIELLPVKGGPARRVSISEVNLRGSIFVHQIDPSGENVLITVRSYESDLWVLGKE